MRTGIYLSPFLWLCERFGLHSWTKHESKPYCRRCGILKFSNK